MPTKKITFLLPSEIAANATEGLLLGDFNNWNYEKGIKLKKQKDGTLKATTELEPGTYQYRYLLNDGRWVNDGNADDYSHDGKYGVDNCVITIAADEASNEPAAKEEKPTEVAAKPKKAAPEKKEVSVEKVKELAKAPAKKAQAKPEEKKTTAKPVASKTATPVAKPPAKKEPAKAAPTKTAKKTK